MKADLLKLATGGGRGWRRWTSRAGHEVTFEGGFDGRGLIVKGPDKPKPLRINEVTRRLARHAVFDIINHKQASGLVPAPVMADMDFPQRPRKAS